MQTHSTKDSFFSSPDISVINDFCPLLHASLLCRRRISAQENFKIEEVEEVFKDPRTVNEWKLVS